MSQPYNQPLPKSIKLSTAQKSLLDLLYTYRFATSALLADARGVKVSATNQSLKGLAEQGLIGRRYEPSYRLHGKAARYCIAKKGVTYLARDAHYDPKILHAYYRNPSLSENFVDTTIQIMTVALRLALTAFYGIDEDDLHAMRFDRTIA
jgi:DNA-binding MarR family transcriptional regulator